MKNFPAVSSLISSLALAMVMSPLVSAAQTAKQDAKDAGTETKSAAKDTGHAVKKGTVKATAAVIKRAHGIFDDYLEDPGSYNSQAVRVEYFKQGPTYSNRALGGFDDDPDHVICPGEGGCRFLYNLRKLEDAIK